MRRRQQHVPWFNPRELDNETLLALSTGRENLLKNFFKAVRERLGHPEIFKHWLLTGARGAGKSFFLRLVQASLHSDRSKLAKQVRFVMLPEEHRNIFHPHELLGEAKRMALGAGDPGTPPAWRVDDPAAAWAQALTELLQAFDEPLLVIGVENFDVLLEQAFSGEADQARLVHLLQTESRLMLLATAVLGDYDNKSSLFVHFDHQSISPWDYDDHRNYLIRRAAREGKRASLSQLARIDAYSRYTGGNARAAAILADAILGERDPLEIASELDDAIDAMTDYFRARIDHVPVNTRKLFDALVRGGDPASQTEIANRTPGARPNEISRAFTWLVDHGYVSESRERGQKSKRYQVLDRLFVQFYRMRSIAPGQRSKLALMADLLVDTITFKDKLLFARRYASEGLEPEALTMAELALKERGVDLRLLPERERSIDKLLAGWEQRDAIVDMLPERGSSGAILEIFQRFQSDDDFRQAIEDSSTLVRAARRGKVQGSHLIKLLEDDLSLCPAEKYHCIVHLLNKTSEHQWIALVDTFEEAVEKFRELESDHAEDIAKLIKTRELGRKYPLAVSLQDLAQSVVEKRKNWFSTNLAIGADLAARAAIQWRSLGHDEEATTSWITCLAALSESEEIWRHPDATLELLISLEPILASLPPNHRILANELKGIALTEVNRFNEAYLVHTAAHGARQALGMQPGRTTWNLEKMAWCAGSAGRIEEAISLHRRAGEERLEQKRPDDFAWNIGQIARYTPGRERWTFLQTELKKAPDQAVRAVQQLGDAVADSVRHRSEAEAFDLARDLLQGLADTSGYPLEASLRALWIDMIEMAVPYTLLRALLGEWQRIFGLRYESLDSLNQMLREWLDDLATPTEAREQRRKSLDPDLAATLSALDDTLPPASRQRLGLPGKNAAAAPERHHEGDAQDPAVTLLDLARRVRMISS